MLVSSCGSGDILGEMLHGGDGDRDLDLIIGLDRSWSVGESVLVFISGDEHALPESSAEVFSLAFLAAENFK